MNMLKQWNAYWFSPAPLVNLAMCRIVLVAFQLGNMMHPSYRGKMQQLVELPDSLYEPRLVLRLLTLPCEPNCRPSMDLIDVVYWIALGAGILALIGLKTNLSLIVFTVSAVFIQACIYSFGEVHHPEAILMIALSILCLSPAGVVLSIDDLRSRLARASKDRKFYAFDLLEEQSSFARWPIFLMQWMLALCYLSGSYHKLKWGVFDWANGFTLQYYLLRNAMLLGEEQGLAAWLAQFHTLVWLLQWITVLFQATFILVPIFPVLGWIYLPLAASFHVGVYLMLRAPFFEWVALYVTFIHWTRVVEGMTHYLGWSDSKNRIEVLFDGKCPLCIRSMTLLRYADWFHAITYTDVMRQWGTLQQRNPGLSLDNCLKEMHVLLPNGFARKGFFAFREMVWRLPLLWPLLLVFYLPLSSIVGPRIYHRIASRRFRFERCTTETCATHSSR